MEKYKKQIKVLRSLIKAHELAHEIQKRKIDQLEKDLKTLQAINNFDDIPDCLLHDIGEVVEFGIWLKRMVQGEDNC